MNIDLLVDRAIARLKRGNPLPVDFQTKLLSVGIDVEALETKYS